MSTSSGAERVREIDTARGVAICLMVFANYTPYLLEGEAPPPFRLFASLAAPLFVFMAGYATVLGRAKKSWKLKSALLLLCSAVLIDVCVWHIWPFMTFDVLYVIAFSIGLIVLLPSSKKFWIAGLLLIVSASFMLRYFFAYRFGMDEAKLSEYSPFAPQANFLSNLVQRMLIDGWFPFFPWIAMALFGRFCASLNFFQNPIFTKYKNWFFVLFLISAGLLYASGFCDARNGYVELFYPPGALYLLLAASWVLCVLGYMPVLSKMKFGTLLQGLGQKSLLVYWLHALIASYLLEQLEYSFDFLLFLLVVTMLLVVINATVFLLAIFHRRYLQGIVPWWINKIVGLN